jgi:drug/metabolite transporter superfamily protein YnfA
MVLCILIFGSLFLNIKGTLSFPLPSKNEKSEVHNILAQFRLFLCRSVVTLQLKGRSQSVWASEQGAEGHT